MLHLCPYGQPFVLVLCGIRDILLSIKVFARFVYKSYYVHGVFQKHCFLLSFYFLNILFLLDVKFFLHCFPLDIYSEPGDFQVLLSLLYTAKLFDNNNFENEFCC